MYWDFKAAALKVSRSEYLLSLACLPSNLTSMKVSHRPFLHCPLEDSDSDSGATSTGAGVVVGAAVVGTGAASRTSSMTSVVSRSSSSFLHWILDQYGTHPFQFFSSRFFHHLEVSSSPSAKCISCSFKRADNLKDCSKLISFLARRFANQASLSFLSKRDFIQLENPTCLSNIRNHKFCPQHVE